MGLVKIFGNNWEQGKFIFLFIYLFLLIDEMFAGGGDSVNMCKLMFVKRLMTYHQFSAERCLKYLEGS